MNSFKIKGLGEYLQQARVEAGITQAEISTRMNYTTPQFVSNIERGRSPAPINLIKLYVTLCKAEVSIIGDLVKKDCEAILKARC